MNKDQREKAKVIAGIQKNIRNKKWTCILDDCNDPAINSHLLQQHGVLTEICNADNHFYEIRTTNANSWKEDEPPVQFKLVGMKEAISLHLFCNKHDTQLFSSIEQQMVDFDDYNSQLLFCLRTAYSEIRKKEAANELYKRMLNANTLDLGYSSKQLLKDTILLNELGIEDVKKDIAVIDQELKTPTNRMAFVHKVYDKQEIYSTTIVSYDPTITNVKDPKQKLDTFFFNVIPFVNELHVLIGYDTNDTNGSIERYVAKWRNCEKSDLGVMLTGIFASKIENWGMSVSLYQQITETKRKEYISLFSSKMDEFPEVLTTSFNLFEGIF